MVGLGVDSVGLATTLLEQTMATKGELVVNNSIYKIHFLLEIFVLSTVIP